MEHGEPNGVQANNGGFIVEDDFIVSPKLSNLSRATFRNMKLRRRRGPQPGCRRYILDNNSPGYGWLLLGWIAEERVVGSGRLYKYYYDPSGSIYRTHYEVLHAWEQSGLVLLDM
ncbi:hypothetical protein SLA2020_455020 [Shorea laevis]